MGWWRQQSKRRYVNDVLECSVDLSTTSNSMDTAKYRTSLRKTRNLGSGSSTSDIVCGSYQRTIRARLYGNGSDETLLEMSSVSCCRARKPNVRQICSLVDVKPPEFAIAGIRHHIGGDAHMAQNQTLTKLLRRHATNAGRLQCKKNQRQHHEYFVSMRKPETRNTQNSDSGRKTFQPSRISWS